MTVYATVILASSSPTKSAMKTKIALENYLSKRVSASGVNARAVAGPAFTLPTKVGEILQGVARDGTPMLVTGTANDDRFPVFSTIDGGEDFAVTRRGNPAIKAESVVRRFAVLRGLDLSLAPKIDILSATPIGKGRASSSQDQQRALLDVAAWFNVPTTAHELYQLMCSVERSDFLFRRNRLIHADPVGGAFCDVAPMPPMAAVLWDDNPSSTVSTSAVAHLDAKRHVFAPIYEDLLDRLASGTASEVFAVSTASAALSQSLLPKRTFQFATDLASRLAGGVIVAHTGTTMGVLLPPEPDLVRRALASVRTAYLLPSVHTLG